MRKAHLRVVAHRQTIVNSLSRLGRLVRAQMVALVKPFVSARNGLSWREARNYQERQAFQRRRRRRTDATLVWPATGELVASLSCTQMEIVITFGDNLQAACRKTSGPFKALPSHPIMCSELGMAFEVCALAKVQFKPQAMQN